MQIIAILISAYLAWCVGVHTVGSVLGISVGSGALKLRNAVIASGLFAVVGAYLFSGRIIDTLGHKLVHLGSTGTMLVLGSAALIVTIAAAKKVPIFTTYLIMGAVAGYSFVSGIEMNAEIFTYILVGLFSAPVVALVIGYMVYKIIKEFKLKNIGGIAKKEIFETKFFLPGILALVLLSVGIGANSIGVVVGVLGDAFSNLTLATIGSIGVVIGLFTWGQRIASTVGVKITDLSPTRGFSALVAAGLVIMFFVLLKIPVSTTQVLIMATAGVGLARGHLEKGTLKTIGLSWVIGIPAAAVVAGLLAWVF